MYDPRSDLRRWDEDRPRTLQPSVGPSDIGGCRRQHAYRHHGTPHSEHARSEAAARLGSLIHLGYAAMLNQMDPPGREAEVRVNIPGLRSYGRADDVDRIDRVVLDVKTTSARAFERWQTYGLPERMWDQVEIYGYGLALVDEGHGEWTLAILLLNRETGEEARFERAADFDHGKALAEALIAEQAVLDASDSPDGFPRDGAGPGRGMPCDWCPWLRECWGPPRIDGLSEQSAMIQDDPEAIAAAARTYVEASAEESKAKRVKGDARTFLEGIPAGRYGDTEVGWTGGRLLDPEPDAEAMVAMLRSYGFAVPTKPGGRTRRSISVKHAHPDTVEPGAPQGGTGLHENRPAKVGSQLPSNGEESRSGMGRASKTKGSGDDPS